jgi:hypothetical protein
MTLHEIKDQNGRVFAFEVGNFLLSRRCVSRIVRSIPGVRLLKTQGYFSWSSEDVFCKFELGTQKFQVWEPFGDNSRYWIGPESAEWCEEVHIVREAFLQHQHSWWRWLGF